MKLIIEIPDEDYKIIKDSTIIGKPNDIRFAIKNGIPLEQIRDEIVEEQSCWREDADVEWHECRRILRIIDKYIKEQTDDVDSV